MHIWKEQHGTEITEQHLRGQAIMTRRNEWETKLEIENIRLPVLQEEKDKEINNNDNTGEQFYQDEENIYETKVTRDDTEDLGQEKNAIQAILDLMNDNSEEELTGFNKDDRCVLSDWSMKINCILKHIRTEYIVDKNILIKTLIVYVGKKD